MNDVSDIKRDSIGRITSMKMEDGSEVSIDYKDETRISAYNPESKTTIEATYDENGRITYLMAENGKEFYLTYDEKGKLKSVMSGEQVDRLVIFGTQSQEETPNE